MVRTSGNGSSRNIFIIEDLPKIKQVIKQIQLGISSQQKAAVQFNVTRHMIRKWYDYFREENAPLNEKEQDILFRQQVVRDVYQKQLRHQDACKKYNITLDTFRRWLKSMPGMVVHKSAKRIPDDKKIEDKLKKEIAYQVQRGDVTQFKAATDLNVTRYTIRKWIYNYPMFNLEGKINYHVMSAEEKNKQLEKEIERLKKELENEKLRSEGLKILIDVAEEKFNIKIKKKPGSPPPQK